MCVCLILPVCDYTSGINITVSNGYAILTKKTFTEISSHVLERKQSQKPTLTTLSILIPQLSISRSKTISFNHFFLSPVVMVSCRFYAYRSDVRQDQAGSSAGFRPYMVGRVLWPLPQAGPDWSGDNGCALLSPVPPCHTWWESTSAFWR